MCLEFADLNSRHRFNKEKNLAEKDWVRESFARDMGQLFALKNSASWAESLDSIEYSARIF